MKKTYRRDGFIIETGEMERHVHVVLPYVKIETVCKTTDGWRWTDTHYYIDSDDIPEVTAGGPIEEVREEMGSVECEVSLCELFRICDEFHFRPQES